MPAEELVEAPGIGAVLWATLAKYDGHPEVLLRRCRDRIDKEGGNQRVNLLAITQVFARMHFDRPDLLEIAGGIKAMIESPIIQQLTTERAWATGVQMTESL